MARPLDSEWFAALAAKLATTTVGAAGEGRLVLGQVVTGTPDGTVSYVIGLDDGDASTLVVGSVDGADVVLVEDYAAATRLLSGTPVARLLGEGAIKLRGDITALLLRVGELATLSAALPSSSSSGPA